LWELGSIEPKKGSRKKNKQTERPRAARGKKMTPGEDATTTAANLKRTRKWFKIHQVAELTTL
jgi:hypothetical protein